MQIMRPPPQPETILVIDDDATNLHVAMEFLGAYSYEILVARDGETGIERANLAMPQLILLDVMMPGIGGIETCRRLKANPATTDIPVIFMTAANDPAGRVRAFEAGAADHVSKPIAERELLARVRVHLELRRRRLEAAEWAAGLERQVQEAKLALDAERTRRGEAEAQSTRVQGAAQKAEAFNRQLSRELTHGSATVTDANKGIAFGHLEAAMTLLAHTDPVARTHVSVALDLLSGAKGPDPEPSPDGDPFEALSPKERAVAILLVAGHSNKEIAFDLGVARTTVSTHRKHVLDKLGVQDLATLVKLAVEWNLQA